jgi:2-hydroxychromene-2-carboxylate isomerase
MRLITSSLVRRLRRWLAEAKRRLTFSPHRVRYFHQVDDPYSHLAAQSLDAITARYDVEIVPMLVGAPPDAAAPERERLVAYARRDAQDVAPFFGLRFHDPGKPPDPEQVALARRVLAGALARSASFGSVAVPVGDALWRADAAGLEAIAARHPPVDAATARRCESGGDATRERLGHYLGGMFHYGGEWYWGVDRLAHLESRLEALGTRRADAPPGPAVACDTSAPEVDSPRAAQVTLEFFPSLRSPYTAISFERVFDVVRRTGVNLVMRPVLPMVMRGLPVPARKRMYILMDTKREADRVGTPFGNMSDPVGRPVERGFSLYPFAREHGRGPEYLHAFTRAAFSEGVDVGSDEGLRHVVESAGLDWQQARPHADGEGWREELEINRETLFGLGLWGVPSFRLIGPGDEPAYTTWGQDRIWRVEQEIARRLAD